MGQHGSEGKTRTHRKLNAQHAIIPNLTLAFLGQDSHGFVSCHKQLMVKQILCYVVGRTQRTGLTSPRHVTVQTNLHV